MDELTVHIEELVIGGAGDEVAVAEAIRTHTGDLLDRTALAQVGRAVTAARDPGSARSDLG
jgi:hypothetical protein